MTMRVVSNVYLSTCGSGVVMDDVRRRLARGGPVVNVFEDFKYNRTGVTLAGKLESVAKDVEEIFVLAMENLSLEDHFGTHPRIGVMDNVLFSPVNPSEMPHLEVFAQRLCQELASSCGDSKCVFYSVQFPLANIRRATPYFQAFNGPIDENFDKTAEIGAFIAGRTSLHPKKGLTCVGAVPWVTNFNIPLVSNDIQKAREVAQAIRSRGGGEHALQSLEAVGLEHQGQVEIACNLLNLSVTPLQLVQSKVEELADARKGYIIGKGWDDLVHLASMGS